MPHCGGMEKTMDENTRTHSVKIDNRKQITVTAVDDVESFDEEKVVILTEMGTMTITGADFRISRLNVDDGQLIIDGEVDEIQYSDTVREENSRGFFGRLFK